MLTAAQYDECVLCHWIAHLKWQKWKILCYVHRPQYFFFKFKKHLECSTETCNTGYRAQMKILEKNTMCETHSTLKVTNRRLETGEDNKGTWHRATNTMKQSGSTIFQEYANLITTKEKSGICCLFSTPFRKGNFLLVHSHKSTKRGGGAHWRPKNRHCSKKNAEKWYGKTRNYLHACANLTS